MTEVKYQVAGILASPPDQRDYIYLPKSADESLPSFFDRRQYIRNIENQLNYGACVGNGGVSSLEAFDKFFGIHEDYSRAFIYNAGRSLEGRLGQEGMFVRTLYKVLQRYGVPLETTYPYEHVADETDPPPEIYNAAAERKIGRYEFVFNSVQWGVFGHFDKWQRVNRIKHALVEGHFPTIALSVTDSIRNMKGPWQQHQYLFGNVNGGPPYIGGHLMYIVGWDDATQKFLVANSWGEEWGDYGIGGFTYDIVMEMWAECWIFRSFEDRVIPEVPGAKLEYSNMYQVGFRIVPEPHRVGDVVRVWIGSPLEDGRWLMNCSLNRNDFRVYDPEADNVMDFSAGEITLAEDNPLKAVHMDWNLDLRKHGGKEVWVAYGRSPVDWKLQHIGKLRDDLPRLDGNPDKMTTTSGRSTWVRVNDPVEEADDR